MNWGHLGDALSSLKYNPFLPFLQEVVIEPNMLLGEEEMRILTVVCYPALELSVEDVTRSSWTLRHQYGCLERLRARGRPFFWQFDVYAKSHEDGLIVGVGWDGGRYLCLAWHQTHCRLWLPQRTLYGIPVDSL
jgi:hypothetical protein